MVEPVWTYADLASAIGVERGSGENGGDGVYGVSIDSRTINKGDLFIAIKGENLDGHAYVSKAFEKGAAAAIVSDPVDGLHDAANLFVVPDTFKAMEQLALASRARVTGKVVGVTGSVGKTGTKEALFAALGRSGPTHASERSYNNDIGVPLTLARMPAATDYGVLEMGMNHAGELRALSAMARPDVAIINNVESVHAEFFDSTEAIADAKAEIMESLTPGGTAILNRDNAYFDRLLSAAKSMGVDNVMTFGEDEAADVRLLKSFQGDDCSTVSADIAGDVMSYRIGVPGAHWIKNSLAVLATVKALGADLGYAGLALGDMVAPKGRGRRHWVSFRDGAILVIDESYNASPVSMRAAIADLANAKGMMPDSGIPGRKIAVLGDMLELGDASEEQHRALAGPLQASAIAQVFTIGQSTPALDEALREDMRGGHADSAADMADLLLDAVQPGDVITIKGSNAMGLSAVVDALLELDADGHTHRVANG